MTQVRVIVKKLNKRKSIPTQFSDKESIVGVVLQNTMFEATEELNVPNANVGRWFRDRDGFFYWGGGLVEQPPAPTTPEIKHDWWFSYFGIEQLWKISTGENIKVALLDSGLDFNLSLFKDNSRIQYYNAFLNTENKDDCIDNDSGHGTNCAGILCGKGQQICGVAPQINLVIIRVTDQFGGRDTGAILKGLQKAIALKCDIISMSFEIPETDPNLKAIYKEIKKAYDLNITMTAAAGNAGIDRDSFPASYLECLSIGGIDKNQKRSNFSNASFQLDLMGPGEEISSFVHDDEKIFGTSFATPFVAGVIAIIKSIAKKKGKTISNFQLFDLLEKNAETNIPGYNAKEYGYGIVNPLRTIQVLNKIL